jgi:GxxExxY protein
MLRLSEMESLRMDPNSITGQEIGGAIEVHRALGPGLLESAYEECLCQEMNIRSILFERQKPLPVAYKGINLDCGYRIDLLIAEAVAVEIKAVSSLEPAHQFQCFNS